MLLVRRSVEAITLTSKKSLPVYGLMLRTWIPGALRWTSHEEYPLELLAAAVHFLPSMDEVFLVLTGVVKAAPFG